MTKDIDLENSDEKLIGVTREIVEAFLSSLADTDVPAAVVDGLRKTLMEDGKRSEKSLLEVIFPASES